MLAATIVSDRERRPRVRLQVLTTPARVLDAGKVELEPKKERAELSPLPGRSQGRMELSEAL